LQGMGRDHRSMRHLKFPITSIRPILNGSMELAAQNLLREWKRPADHLDSAVLCFLIGCIKYFISTSRWCMRPFEVQEARLICCRLLTVVSILTIRYSTERPFCFSKTLLIHTETCEPYSTANKRCTLRRFIQYTHPELDNVTPNVIRSSFATWQFQRYRQKLCFRELREDEFLQKIAKVMNTSVEMLRSTYLAYSERDDDHLAAMREIHCMFDEE
jgi:hypothetical protein